MESKERMLLRMAYELEANPEPELERLILPVKRELRRAMIRAPFIDTAVCRVADGGVYYFPNGLVDCGGVYKTVLAPYTIPGRPDRKLGPDPVTPPEPKPARKVCGFRVEGSRIMHVFKNHAAIALQYYAAKGKKLPKYKPKKRGNHGCKPIKTVINFCRMLETVDEDIRSSHEIWDVFTDAAEWLKEVISGGRIIHLGGYDLKCAGFLSTITPEAVALIDEKQEGGRIWGPSYEIPDDVMKLCHNQELVWTYSSCRWGNHNKTKPIPVEHIMQLRVAYETLDAVTGTLRDALVYMGVLQPEGDQDGVPNAQGS